MSGRYEGANVDDVLVYRDKKGGVIINRFDTPCLSILSLRVASIGGSGSVPNFYWSVIFTTGTVFSVPTEL